MLDKDCDSQTWAIVLQAFWSFSFGHWLLFHSLSVQFLYPIIFRPDGFLFVKPLNSDLWIIQTWKRWSNVLSTQNRQLSKESGLYLSFVTSSSFQKHRIFFPFLYMNLQKIPNITEFGWRKSVFFFSPTRWFQRGICQTMWHNLGLKNCEKTGHEQDR